MRSKGSRGFTLLEILIAVVLVAILAAIAIPSYSSYLIRGQRAQAKAALQQAAQFLERNYTTTGCYNYTGACTTGTAITVPTPANAPSGGGQFTYALTVAFPTGQAFQLIAAPCGTSATACPTTGSNTTFSDLTCGALTLDNTGTQGIDKTGTGTGSLDTTSSTAASCWQR
jgi:type IV pilus assembly protein PilE